MTQRNLHLRYRPAFTLAEMIVTVALMVVLMLAVTQIFSIASRTISGGQALGAAVRDAQAAQSVLGRDFTTAVRDGPCFVIRSERVWAFRNQQDLKAGGTDASKYDIDGDGTLDDLNAAPYGIYTYNIRNHRTDWLMFFARDRFSRQTGNQTTPQQLVADMTSNQAAIFIHHLAIGDNSLSGFPGPAAGTPSSNPNNLTAAQWALGREAVLLVKPDASNKIYDRSGVTQDYIKYDPSVALSPLAPTSPSTFAAGTQLISSRFDLAGTDIDTYAQQVAAGFTDPQWQVGTTYAAGDKVQLNGKVYQCSTSHTATETLRPPKSGYWSAVASATAPAYATTLVGASRFWASAFAARPINSASASLQAPIFVPACSQFMVEFAGDFFTQDPNGNITDTVPDQVVDFIPGTNGAVRWYGLPRDTTGDGKICAADGDVVPARDVQPAGGQVVMPFEHLLPTAAAVDPIVDWRTQTGTGVYVVGWTRADTNIPKMLRIVIAIDRPEGELPDEQTFEYVFNLGQ